MNNELPNLTKVLTPIETKKPVTMIVIKEQVLFPYQNTHFDVSTEKSLKAINKALGEDKCVFITTQKHNNAVNVAPKDIYRVGVVAAIKQIIKLPNNVIRVVVNVIERKAIETYVTIQPCFEVLLNDIIVPIENEKHVDATFRGLKAILEDYKKLDIKKNLDSVVYDDPDKMVFSLIPIIFAKDADKIKLLSEPSLIARMEECAVCIASEIELAGIEKNMQAKVRKRIDKNQKEYFLREQQKVISEELGDNSDEIDVIKDKIAAIGFAQDVAERLGKEIARLSNTSAQSPEYGVIRTYLETIIDLPWKHGSQPNLDLKNAKTILDTDHFGLDKVKERIVEYLAVNKLTGTLKAPILCFVGPPGVGKTSIVNSIAKASGREFVSMSLGGVRDEAEIRGHRRTYIGSMVGRIIAGIRNAKVNNPVFLLDEIDKMSSDFRGDPASALLEVLDPNQNTAFKDHYLDLEFDLSKVMFVTTANSLDTIPLPLLDRMEVIELTGYTYEEKCEIAKKYLIPKQIAANGLTNDNIVFMDTTVKSLINNYTSESGVRGLERQIGAVCRKVAVTVVDNPAEKAVISSIDKYLGAPKVAPSNKRLFDEIGVATGLAWTTVGGKTLSVEAVAIKGGKGDIKLTGQIGDVMQESCHTAFSLIKTRADKYHVKQDDFKNFDFHMHFPEGATKKDGPSAGITIATAFMSVLSRRPIDCKVAMTGEVTLSGRVLAIGGLKEKTLAALRDGITTLVLAKDNEKDIDDIPKSVRDKIKIVWVSNIDEVFDIALK